MMAYRGTKTGSIERSIRRLVMEQCSNYAREQNSVKDYCCLEQEDQHRCSFALRDESRCHYFEESVLGLDKQLETLYWVDRSLREQNNELSRLQKKLTENQVAAPTMIDCARCGRSFPVRSNRQKYCSSCGPMVRNEQKRLWRVRQQAST